MSADGTPRLNRPRQAVFAGVLIVCAVGAVAQQVEPGAASMPSSQPKTVAAGAAVVQAVPRSWALRLPSVDRVAFHGSVSRDAVGMGTGAMMYPAANAAGLLAAIVTHGLINARLLQDQKDRLQQQDDLVLQPFEPVLGGFTNRQLMQAGLQKMSSKDGTRLLVSTESAGGDWLVESVPVFWMTQDQRALVLDNAVRIVAPGSSTVSYAQTIRVVSAPLAVPVSPAASAPPAEAGPASSASSASASADDAASNASGPAAVWLELQGRRLTEVSSALFAESLDVALSDAIASLGDGQAAYKTFRYPEGGRERMERAQLVSERCGRTLIRTLRGGLMSIPTGAARCAAP